jgi:predicted XRE-type DNA-binding protein
MGGVGNVSGGLHRKDGGNGIRAARVSKKITADKQARHRVGAQPIRTVKRAAKVISEGPPYEEFDSIWEALGIPPVEAANLEARANLMIELRRIIDKNAWTQVQAARRCGVSQPRINDLLRGKIDRFSVDSLMNMAAALGCKVRVELVAA